MLRNDDTTKSPSEKSEVKESTPPRLTDSGLSKWKKPDLHEQNELQKMAEQFFDNFILLKKLEGKLKGIEWLLNGGASQATETALLTGDANFSSEGVHDALEKLVEDLNKSLVAQKAHCCSIEAAFVEKFLKTYPEKSLPPDFLQCTANSLFNSGYIFDAALKMLEREKGSFWLTIQDKLHPKRIAPTNTGSCLQS